MHYVFKDHKPKYEGYLQVVEESWKSPLPWSTPDIDAFCCLNFKLRNTAKMLRSWSAKNIGSVRLQLAIAKEIVLRLDAAQDIRSLAQHELALRRKAKLCSLGLHYKEHWLSSVHGSLTWPRGTPTQNFSTYRPVIGAGRGIFQN